MLVHGAYSSPELFGPIKTKLEALSYDVVTVQLPTSDRISADKTVNDDVEAIRSAIIPYIDGGKEVVIATHSYGGIPGCASTEGLSVKERAAQGKRGGFRAILFMAAFALPKAGVTCNDSFGKEVPEWLDLVVCTWFLEPNCRSDCFLGWIRLHKRKGKGSILQRSAGRRGQILARKGCSSHVASNNVHSGQFHSVRSKNSMYLYDLRER